MSTSEVTTRSQSERPQEYTAVIRTLGKSGDLFEREITSLNSQTFPPKQILVYIPHGYRLPEAFEGSGKVTYIRCDKGMVTQRSLAFEEVNTPLMLFLDDDVELPPRCMETLVKELEEYGGDCIVANTFPMHQNTIKEKLIDAIFFLTLPSSNRKYAFRVRNSSYFSYATTPSPVMLSQSGAGPCALMKTSIFRQLEFEQERWIEKSRYALGEDQLMFNKIHQGGKRLLVSSDCGAIHLDAQSSRNPEKKDNYYSIQFVRYLLWHRTKFETASSSMQKFYRTMCFYSAWAWLFCIDIPLGLIQSRRWRCGIRIKALRDAIRYRRSDEYRSLRPFRLNLK